MRATSQKGWGGAMKDDLSYGFWWSENGDGSSMRYGGGRQWWGGWERLVGEYLRNSTKMKESSQERRGRVSKRERKVVVTSFFFRANLNKSGE